MEAHLKAYIDAGYELHGDLKVSVHPKLGLIYTQALIKKEKKSLIQRLRDLTA